jgi:hypothetical protein
VRRRHNCVVTAVERETRARETYVGRFAHTEVISSPADTGIPAAPGHYSTNEILGFQAPPGVSFQIQVVKIPNR